MMYQGDIRDWPKRVRFGAGALASLAEVLESLGATRAVIVCGRSVHESGMLERTAAALGPRLVGTFAEVRAHTPFEDVERAAAVVRGNEADAIVSVGGGSAIDAAKGVVLIDTTGGNVAPYAIDFVSKGMARAPLARPRLRHVTVPTTAGSASDVMPTAGIRDPRLPKKMLFWDDALVPDATILDPQMAVFAGPELTAATGMTAVARAIECLYSKHRHPISTGLALHAARLLRAALPASVERPRDLAARADCQMACLMSGTASINAMVSIVHAIGHVTGGRYGLQHGISHAILLAPALRRMLPAIGSDTAYVLEALGCPADGGADAAANAVGRLLESLPLPKRLRDVGVNEADLPGLAQGTMGDYMMANLPIALTAGDVESLLREAW